MSALDVDIPFQTMQELVSALDHIVTEFDAAGSRTAELRDAIGSPQGRSELRDAADDFEARWDDKRETLRRKLEDVRARVDDTRGSWAELDVELATPAEAA